MKDQHTKITGYRDLTQDEIDTMNAIKEVEAHVAQIVKQVQVLGESDLRCAAVAVTNFQQAFMWLVRAVARPVNPFE